MKMHYHKHFHIKVILIVEKLKIINKNKVWIYYILKHNTTTLTPMFDRPLHMSLIHGRLTR